VPLSWDSVSTDIASAPRGSTTAVNVTLEWTAGAGAPLDAAPTIKLEQNDGTVILSTSSSGDLSHGGSCTVAANFNIPIGTPVDTAYKVYALGAIATIAIDGDSGNDTFEVLEAVGRPHRYDFVY